MTKMVEQNPLHFFTIEWLVPGHLLVCKAIDTNQVKSDGQQRFNLENILQVSSPHTSHTGNGAASCDAKNSVKNSRAA